MSPKAKIVAIIAFTLIATLVFMSVMFSLFRENERAAEQADAAGQIMVDVFARRLLAEEFTQTRTDRAKEQWLGSEAAIVEFITAHESEFEAGEEAKLITDIEKSISGSRGVFESLVALYADTATVTNQRILAEKEARISSQLSVKAQETIALASHLKDINDESEREAFRRILLLFSVSGTLLVLVLIVSFWQIWNATDTLEKQRSQNAAILSGIGDGVFVIDTSGKIILFNKASSLITGFSEKEAIGRRYFDLLKFVNEDTKAPTFEFVQTALSGTKSVMPRRTMLPTKSGKIIPVADSAAPVYDSSGAIAGAVVVFRDITSERELENAKEEFVALASHQLRTPIVIIQGYLDLLIDELSKEITPERKLTFNAMQRAILSLTELVNGMLNVSRVETGTIGISPEPTDLPALLDKTLGEFKIEMQEKNFTFEKKYAENIPTINVDQRLTVAIVRNLMSNAIKYTPIRGSISVVLEKTDSEVVVSVTDSGLGIPKDQQDKVFSKFYRADNALENKIEGTGLGLYVVKSIIDEAGGRIWFSCEEKKGCTFSVAIPLSGMKKKEGMKGLT